MSQNFPDRAAAAAYVTAHDDDVNRLSRYSHAGLAMEARRALAASGARQGLRGGPSSPDELTASILILRHPMIAEARAVLAETEPEPEAPGFSMTDEAMLKLVQDDSSSDFSEGVGEHGGFVSYSIQGDVLIVTVRAYPSAEANEAEFTERRWRLVPFLTNNPR